MKFTPKTEKEIEEANLWGVGEYDFTITEGTDTQSKAGNDMIVLTVQVYNEQGGYKIITDFLLEAIEYKLRHAAEACGLLEQYETGFLEGLMFKGKSGRCKLGIEKDKTGQYADKNRITDYLVDKSKRSANGGAATQTAQNDLNDEIPF